MKKVKSLRENSVSIATNLIIKTKVKRKFLPLHHRPTSFCSAKINMENVFSLIFTSSVIFLSLPPLSFALFWNISHKSTSLFIWLNYFDMMYPLQRGKLLFNPRSRCVSQAISLALCCVTVISRPIIPILKYIPKCIRIVHSPQPSKQNENVIEWSKYEGKS